MTDRARTTPQRIELTDRVCRALELRRQGKDFKCIAETCGYPSPEAARKAITRLLRRTEGKYADEYRLDLTDRMNQMYQALAPGIAEGNLAAIALGLNVLKQISALNCLDGELPARAPTHADIDREMDIAAVLGGPMPEFDAEDIDGDPDGYSPSAFPSVRRRG